MNNLKLVLHEGHILYKTARATYHPFTDDIVLYLPNIMTDLELDEEKLWSAIDHLVLIELTCSIITNEINNNKPICKGDGICPINEILKKVGLNHEIKPKCKNIEKLKPKGEKTNYEEGDHTTLITSANLAHRIKKLTNEIR